MQIRYLENPIDTRASLFSATTRGTNLVTLHGLTGGG